MKHLNAPIKDWIYEENRSQKENEVHKKTRNLVNERHVRKVTNKRSINESERMF